MAEGNIKRPGEMDFSDPQGCWPEWKRRFLRYRSASGLDERGAQRQVDTLIYTMGEEAEAIYEQLVVRAPRRADLANNVQAEDANGTLFDRTVEAFDNYFMPRNNHLHYAVLLGSRVQRQGETNEQFIRNVHELATKCTNWNQEHRNDMVRTRLLAGMRDKDLSRELQLNADITLNEVKQQLRTKEIIYKNQQTELDTDSSKAVMAVDHRSGRPNREGRPSGEQLQDCEYCGGYHAAGRCPAYNRSCNRCGTRGHYAKKCRRPQKSKGSRDTKTQRPMVNPIDMRSDSDSSDDSSYHVHAVDFAGKVTHNKWLLNIILCDQTIEAKVDTGAQVSTISKTVFLKLGLGTVTKTKVKLTGYGGVDIPVIGRVRLSVSTENGNNAIVKFYVTDSNNQTLLGMPAITELGLLPSVQIDEVSGHKIVEEYKDVFTGLGMVGEPIELVLKADAKPRAVAPRVVPHNLRGKLKTELDKLLEQGVIIKDTSPSEWLCPLVLVNKPSGDLRLCLDPQYLNKQLVRAQCAIPTNPEIFARVAGSKVYTTLDAKQGFHQIPLGEKSSKLLSFVTPFGKFRYVRLGMGICNSSEIFHQTMADAFSDIDGVEVYIDDLLIHAPTVEEHDSRLKQVLDRCRSIGLTLNPDKAIVGRSAISFLGHELTSDGIKASDSKVEAVKNMTVPEDKLAVQRFLGFVNYLAKFIPNLSEHSRPLREASKKNVSYFWCKAQQDAFDKIKSMIADAPTLAYYDSKSDVTLSADSSSHSIGAVVLQEGRPIEFAAKTLTDCQGRYSQIEKELLAILYACERFKYYCLGQKSIRVETDHLPLLGLMDKEINSLSPRLAAMRLRLLGYPIDLIYKPGKEMVLADTLSRSCPDGTNLYDDLGYDPLVSVCSVVIRSEEVMEKYKNATRNDEELQVVSRYVQEGWPSHRKNCAGRALAYYNLRESLSVVDGVIFYGKRLVIPIALRNEVLESLHKAHQGVSKTLQRASESVFWPGMRKRIEEKCQSCHACMSSAHDQCKEPLIPFAVPETPFETVGVDLFYIDGIDYLLLVDYLTKWPVVKKLSCGTGSRVVINVLKEVFSDFGRPSKIVSDNGPQFASSQFREFCNHHEIKHVTSSPIHPSGNGQSERSIGTVKSMMRKCSEEGTDWMEGLLTIRNTPIANGLPSPAELLQGRTLRDSHPVSVERYKVQGYDLDMIRAKLGDIKSSDKYYHDSHAKSEKQSLESGQSVYFKSASGDWRPGKIVGLVGDRSYTIQAKHCVVRRNRVDIRPCSIEFDPRHSVGRPNVIGQGHDEEPNNQVNPDRDVETLPRPEQPVVPADHAPNIEPDPHLCDRSPRPRRQRRRPLWHQDYVM